MSNIERHSHWQNIYQTKGERDVSWFQEGPRISLDLRPVEIQDST